MLKFIFAGDILIFVSGLIVGWNLLPQPAWVKRVYEWVKGMIKS